MNSELTTFCCSQTVKSNILLSQNAGNAISETLDVQNFTGGACPRTPLAGLGLCSWKTATRSTAPRPFQNPGSASVSCSFCSSFLFDVLAPKPKGQGLALGLNLHSIPKLDR